MSPSTALVLAPATLGEALTLAQALAGASLLPAHAKSPASILACLLAGQELGLPPMTSLRSMHYLDGKPVLTSEAMLAIAIRGGAKPTWVTATDREATLRIERPGFAPTQVSWTIAMAQVAGLANKDNWKRHPGAMLRARAISACVRMACPDILLGVHSEEEAEEIQATQTASTPTPTRSVEVVDAEVVDSVPRTAPEPARAPSTPPAPTTTPAEPPARRGAPTAAERAAAWGRALAPLGTTPEDVDEWLVATVPAGWPEGAAGSWRAGDRKRLLEALGTSGSPEADALSEYLCARFDDAEQAESSDEREARCLAEQRGLVPAGASISGRD
jgi:hypothetical protein